MSKEYLWINGEKKDTIAKAKLVVTDKKKFAKICDELKNVENYVKPFEYDSDSNQITRTENSIIVYENSRQVQYINRFTRINSILNGEIDEQTNLLELFATYSNNGRPLSSSMQRKLFLQAQQTIKELENASLNPAIVKTLINSTWPDFGYFATEALCCSELVYGETTYNLQDMNYIVEECKKLNLPVASQIKTVLSKKELASTNAKVYELAKRANKLTR